MSEKEDPWSRRDNKDPLKTIDEIVCLGTENLLRWLKAFLRLRFLSSKSFPLPAPRTPRPVPGSNPETRGGLGRPQHSHLRSGKKKKKECVPFHFKPVVRFGPLPDRTGNINFVPMWLFRGRVLHSETQDSFPNRVLRKTMNWEDRAESGPAVEEGGTWRCLIGGGWEIKRSPPRQGDAQGASVATIPLPSLRLCLAPYRPRY